MEALLKGLFDFQKFERNPTLQSVIDEIKLQTAVCALSDEDVDGLFAAGDPNLQIHDPSEGEPWRY